MPQYWGGPFRVRTFLRSNLPWFVINTGIVDKGENCLESDGAHEWYNADDHSSACYHCSVTMNGELWVNGSFKLYIGKSSTTHTSMESAIEEASKHVTNDSYLRIEAVTGSEIGSWWAYDKAIHKWSRS